MYFIFSRYSMYLNLKKCVQKSWNKLEIHYPQQKYLNIKLKKTFVTHYIGLNSVFINQFLALFPLWNLWIFTEFIIGESIVWSDKKKAVDQLLRYEVQIRNIGSKSTLINVSCIHLAAHCFMLKLLWIPFISGENYRNITDDNFFTKSLLLLPLLATYFVLLWDLI